VPGTPLALSSAGKLKPHGERTAIFQETIMNTRTSSKLAAFAIALMMNSFIIGGVAYLFDAQTHQHSSPISLAERTATFRYLI
jgi:Mn2+/Fe2+ NRAMP family transporter